MTMSILKHLYEHIAVAVLSLAVIIILFSVYEGRQNQYAPSLSVEWPKEGVVINDMQTFQVRVFGVEEPARYSLTWHVSENESGQLVFDGMRYVNMVSVTGWDWQKDNRYPITFTLSNEDGDIVAVTEVPVFVDLPAGLSASNDSEVAISDEEGGSFLFPMDDDAGVLSASVVQSISPAPAPTPQPVISAPVPIVPSVVEIERPLTINWQPAPASQTQRFVFELDEALVGDINAFWQTDGGHRNMIFERDGQGRYVTGINFFGWQWKGKGPYPISFAIADAATAKEMARVEYEMVWEDSVGGNRLRLNEVSATSAYTQVASTPTATPSPVIPTPVSAVPTNPIPTPTTPAPAPRTQIASVPFAASGLYVQKKPAVESGRATLTEAQDRALIDQLLTLPSAIWLNGNEHDSSQYIASVMTEAGAQNAMPVFVLYNIPHRDCGSHSSGGASSADQYRSWIDRVSSAIGQRRAMVIIEPDALAQLNCAPVESRGERLALLRYAVDTFARTTEARTYIDAGHPFWVNAEEMANRLRSAGIENATGFSLNVSNFVGVPDNHRYGSYLSSLLNGKRYVIDTSRNGNGPDPELQWCNPRGRAIGPTPRLVSAAPLDAYLWIKYPGESDGQCNGGPRAGVWWPEYTLELIKNSRQ